MYYHLSQESFLAEYKHLCGFKTRFQSTHINWVLYNVTTNKNVHFIIFILKPCYIHTYIIDEYFIPHQIDTLFSLIFWYLSWYVHDQINPRDSQGTKISHSQRAAEVNSMVGIHQVQGLIIAKGQQNQAQWSGFTRYKDWS